MDLDYFKKLKEYNDTLKTIKDLQKELELKPFDQTNRSLRKRLELRKKINERQWREYSASCNGFQIDSKRKPIKW